MVRIALHITLNMKKSLLKYFNILLLSSGSFLFSQNHSLSFDGIEDHILIDNTAAIVGTDDFSIAFWFKTENLTSSNTYKMLVNSDTGNQQWTFAIEYGGLEGRAIGVLSFIVFTGGAPQIDGLLVLAKDNISLNSSLSRI